MTWLIAARTVQGAGGGAIQAVASIIISDLVSLKERGVYNSLIGLTWGVACTLGPLVGGAFAQQGNWRWIFYMNLPIAGLSAALVFFSLKLRKPEGRTREKLARMDWVGNILIIASTSACIIGLTWGGIQYAWNSAHVLGPFIVGLCGIGAFLYYEAKFAKYPMAPLSLISNGTSISGYAQIFALPVINLAVTYYQETYYQACKGATAIRSGVLTLAVSLCLAPAMIICGLSITISKGYRVQLWLGWVVLIVAMGLMSTVDSRTELVKPQVYTGLVGTGVGILYAGTYFPVLAPLPISENAHALSFFIFCRSFAGVWGVTIGGAILQNQLQKRLPAEFLQELPQGVALAFSAIPSINNLEDPLRSDVRQAFAKSIASIWQVMVGIAGIGLISSLFMKAFLLHTQLDERWGLDEKQLQQSDQATIENDA
ncbi:hypothetical protein EW026_g7491 [Hermanssonia centrifuga]|uniref:Major facilitator superfamily (MFS) profile domain-containing protein n=1 Tax=Hermanssonia centrifuga TaxID=98765 RepID=A0A4S4KC47_9APHY|nr:hypothetical protein EW026_g7491 [Hermanssonia centrifuga]